MASGTTAGDKDLRWYFTVEQLQKSPSRKSGIDSDQELQHRQNAAYLIQGMGERLRVSQLCINTAIVYMHRFYAFHSFTHFHRNGIAAASLFLAAKVEEQPRKLDTVIHTAHVSLNMEMPDPSKESYQEQAQDLVFNENVLLQTLGFDVAVDHPHTHVVKTCHLVKACKDLAQTSYFLASNSLHLTTMCLQYRPTVVACFCIYLACKWSRWEIPQSTEGKYWFHYVDKTVTMELLEQLTNEFLVIYEKSPARLKTKLNSIKPIGMSKGSDVQKTIGHPSSSSESRSMHSSSSEHRSSHHRSNHHHKQQSQSGDNPAAKHMVQMPQKLPHQNSSSSSSSSTSRHRPERGERPQPVPEPHFPSLHRTSGSSKLPPPPKIIGDTSVTIQPGQSSQQRSSSSSHSSLDPNYQMSMSKSRSSMSQQHLPTSMAAPESHRHLSKIEQRQHGSMKDPKVIDPTKSLSKSQQQPVNNLYPTGSENQRSSSSSTSLSLTRPQSYSQPPNYSQAIANRNLVDHSSVHMQKQQQQLPPPPPLQMPTAESSFRLTDDLSRLTEPLTIHSPPKQSTTKAPSIFSPEWNDKPSSMPSMNSNNMKQPGGGSVTSGNSSISNNNGLNVSLKAKDSPKKHEKRPETPKKDKRIVELPVTPIQQKIPNPIEKQQQRSNSAKKLSDTPGMPVINVPPPVSPFETTSVHKQQQQQLPHGISVPIKRTLPDDLIKQEDGIDFREAKMRKLDIQPLSPPRSNKSAPYMQQQQPPPNVPVDNLIKSQTSYTNALNGIETNPDLVSSLLKESLCNENKYTPFNPNVNPIGMPLQQQQMQPPQILSHQQMQQPQLMQQQLQQMQLVHQAAHPLLNTVKLEFPKQEIIDASYSQQQQQQPPMEMTPTDPLPPQIKVEPSSSEMRIKSEKKKKKDKHKHKEKDKTKDKEERKKHKKRQRSPTRQRLDTQRRQVSTRRTQSNKNYNTQR